MEDRVKYSEIKTINEINSNSKEKPVLKKLRKFSKIPIFITDYHNDVLEFIYRCFGSRHLPLRNNILLHFDSHPDMVIPSIKPDNVYDKNVLLSELSIENWIMPMCYAGHINRLLWVKNVWCDQIPVGNYEFEIGQRNGRICVSSPLDYFISEGSFCSVDILENSRHIQLEVINTDVGKFSKTFFSPIDDESYLILDIDLDFFSTTNPFLHIFQEINCYQQLEGIFQFERSSTVAEFAAKRKVQLENLKLIFEYLEKNRTLDNMTTYSVPENTFIRIKQLVKDLELNYDDSKIDWLLLYDAGCTSDNNGLPHHISTPEQLEEYFDYFKKFLLNIPVNPVVITIARSAEDDYCPKSQVEFIQQRVLSILGECFDGKVCDKPIARYLDEEWNIMDL